MSFLDDITSALGPGEAEAASPQQFQQQRALKEMGFQQQNQLQQIRMAQAAQALQMRLAQQQELQNQRLQAQQAMQQERESAKPKKQEKPQVSDIMQSLQQPSSGEGGPEAPILRGTNIATGNPVFSNIPRQTEQSPAFAQGIRWQPQPVIPGTQAAQAAPTQPGAINPQAAAQRAQAAAQLKAAGVPEKELERALDAMLPGTKAAKELTPEQAGKMFKYDPETLGWLPLAAEDYDKPVKELEKQGYRIVTQQQQDSSKTLPAMVAAFNQLKDSYDRVSKQGIAKRAAGSIPYIGSYAYPEGTQYLKDVQQFTTFFDSEVMGKRGASSPQMQKLRSQVVPQLYTNPAIGKKLLQDFSTIMNIIKNNQVRMYSGQAPDIKAEEAAAKAINDKYEATSPEKSNRLETARRLMQQGIDLNAQVGGQK